MLEREGFVVEVWKGAIAFLTTQGLCGGFEHILSGMNSEYKHNLSSLIPKMMVNLESSLSYKNVLDYRQFSLMTGVSFLNPRVSWLLIISSIRKPSLLKMKALVWMRITVLVTGIHSAGSTVENSILVAAAPEQASNQKEPVGAINLGSVGQTIEELDHQILSASAAPIACRTISVKPGDLCQKLADKCGIFFHL